MPSASAHEAREDGGTLTRAKRRSPVSGSRDHRRQVQRQVGDVRERMRRVDGERREHREDPLLEDRRELLALGVAEVVPADDARCPLRASDGTSSSSKTVSCSRTSSSTIAPIAVELLAGVRPSGRRRRSMPAATWSFSAATRTWKNSSRLDERWPELHPFEQRNPRLLGQRQHASVEVEPAQLTVERRSRAATRLPPSLDALRSTTESLVSGRPRSHSSEMRSRSASRMMRSRLRRNCGSSRGSSTSRAITRARNSSSTRAVAVVAVHLPMRRHRAEVHDSGVSSWWLVDDVGHGVPPAPRWRPIWRPTWRPSLAATQVAWSVVAGLPGHHRAGSV